MRGLMPGEKHYITLLRQMVDAHTLRAVRE